MKKCYLLFCLTLIACSIAQALTAPVDVGSKGPTATIDCSIVLSSSVEVTESEIKAGVWKAAEFISEIATDEKSTAVVRGAAQAAIDNIRWSRCEVHPIFLQGRRMIDLYFVVDVSMLDSAATVIHLCEVGAAYWKVTYDVDAKTFRSYQFNALSNAANYSLKDRSTEKISVDFPDESIGRILRNVADLFELDIAIPEELFAQKIPLTLKDVTWQEVFQNALADTDYYIEVHGQIVSILKRKIDKK
jgi:hypothetical protein